MTTNVTFTKHRAIAAEGARVGIVSCKLCGAALILDPADTSFDPLDKHIQWHHRVAEILGRF